MNKTTLTVILMLLVSTIVVSQSQKSENNLEHIKTLQDSTAFLNSVRNLEQLVNEGQLDSATNLANALINVGIAIGYTNGLGQAYIEKGRLHQKYRRDIASNRNFEHAIYYFQKSNNVDGLAKVYSTRFIIERGKGNFEKASDYLLHAKLYREQLQDSIGLTNIYNNLGIMYNELKNVKAAETYYLKSIELRKQLNLDELGLVMNNLALLYTENGDLFKAHDLVSEALVINKKDKDFKHIAQSYSIMAKIALYQKEYKTAKKYYDTTLCVASQTNFKILAINAQQQLGIVALKERAFEKAEELLRIARKGFAEVNAQPLLLKNYQYSFKLDSTKGDLLRAISWQQKYQELLDKRMSDLASKKVEKTKAQYEAELEQLKLIEEQRQSEQETRAKLFKFRLIAYSAVAAVLLISVFLMILIKNKNERQRLIRKLDNSNKVKNKLFSIIAHDLKNEINGLDGTLKLLKENAISEKEFKEIIPFLSNGTHQTSILLHNLLNWSKSQLKELNANPVYFDITEVINEKFTFFERKAREKEIKLINKLEPTPIYADKDMFGIVAQNLIANAIKFCNPGDSIALLSLDRENHYEICFQDTGVGIKPAYIDKLFAEDTFTTPGTQNETGTGLGLKICKELIELNQGKIEVQSEPGTGSTFCISLPKAA
ncbi:tetratricopeptide repeat-containing sensor histidine kinase [Aquimarina sp. U1-2]|uniref:tetratricopeptide repeat-containing sensor histidine kinase n=1 Tax=Aquimarina sp. U1-2 TaxID=2823141 RepID=UPI001AECD3D2|nr:tetratricopeptide repeat-containing sensor histidine kinase [Aquimarina sp. U1-2]MBP2832981.1 tetratricopeptide repeat-containing sensor histidine kinase [Aquimarina sp. U1-2]